MKIIGEILASFRNTSYLCNVKCMFDYPGRIPRGQAYIDTTHFKRVASATLFILETCVLLSYPENTEKYHRTIVPSAVL